MKQYIKDIVELYFNVKNVDNPTDEDKKFMAGRFNSRSYTKKEYEKMLTEQNKDGLFGLSYEDYKRICFPRPIVKGNYSVYEKVDFSKKLKIINGFNKYEIPIVKKQEELNEISVYDIPEARKTRSTKYTIEYLLEQVPLLNIKDIEKFYYKDKPETETSIAMSILVYWEEGKLDKEDSEQVKSSMKTGGYYLVYEDIATNSIDNIKYIRQYYEPYWPEKELIRIPEYVYHVTAKKNEEPIKKYGFIPKSEQPDLNYPDRIYFFLKDDRQSMFQHMRHNRKSLQKNEKGEMLITIFKVKVPDDLVLFLDTRTYDHMGNLIEDAVYSYDPVSADNIESYESVNIIGQSFKLFKNIN